MTHSAQFDAVKDFNLTFGHSVRVIPTLNESDLDLRVKIFLEEVEEIQKAVDGYRKAVELGDEQSADHWEIEFLDGLADTLVTLFGLAQGTGMPILEAFDAVHESNMSKLEDGKPVYYPEGHEKAGKIAKGKDFKPPTEDLRRILGL